jgi:hypothetical protein
MHRGEHGNVKTRGGDMARKRCEPSGNRLMQADHDEVQVFRTCRRERSFRPIHFVGRLAHARLRRIRSERGSGLNALADLMIAQSLFEMIV